MNRSARSVKQNIVEGWKRNTTRQYNEFLGFAIASCAELKEDCEDIWIGAYTELFSKREIMGEKGNKRDERDEWVKWGEGDGEGIKREKGEEMGKWLESLRFYPLDESLPPVVRLYLRSKELCYLIDKTQQSLQKKMIQEYGLTAAERQTLKDKEQKKQDDYLEKILVNNGQVMTTRGIMDKEEAERKGVVIIKHPKV